MNLPLPPRRARVAAAGLLTLVALAGLLAPVSGTGPLPDVAWHALAGAGLAVAYAVALEPRPPRVVLGGAVLLAVGVLGAGELLQPLAGRGAEAGDLLADAAGAVAGAVAYRSGHRRLRWG